MIRNRKKELVIVTALIATMAIAGTSAYFTASDHAENIWTVGKVKIDLQESEYDKYKDTETVNIMPNSELHKDPKVENTGNNDAFVFMKVRVPKALVKVAGQDGTVPSSASMQELFDYQWNTGWTVINDEEVQDADGTTYQQYVVTYGTANKCKALKAGETTPVLLINGSGSTVASPGAEGMITFKNIIEGQNMENTDLKLDVESYAIQTSNLTTEDTSDPSKVWAILSNQAGA